jgi:mono/diheme cytochrome c family protein
MRRLGFALVLVLIGCSKPSSGGATATTAQSAVSATPSGSASDPKPEARSPRPDPEPPGDAARGKELAGKFECARCHGGLEVAAVDRTRHCVDCHQDVMGGKFDAKPDAPKWRKHVAHMAVVPSLGAIGKRVQYGWLVEFLLEPKDLRPELTQMMPRLALTREQARDVATYLMGDAKAAAGDDPLAGADLTKGRKLLDEMQCGSCHRMTGVAALEAATPIGAPAATYYAREAAELRPAVMLAPDLRFTRERSSPAQVIAWLLDPQGIKKDTPMPKTPMSAEQARDIAAYVLRTPLEAAPPFPLPVVPPVLSRRVGYEEVAKEVLDVTCRHCHGNADVALGDGGPGNTGGFGFAPRGVSFTTYEQVQGGYLDDKGERHSLFEKTKDGTPRLIAALWARHKEIAGQPDPEVRGMPLGLPPLPPEQIQLIATWVSEGRPK